VTRIGRLGSSVLAGRFRRRREALPPLPRRPGTLVVGWIVEDNRVVESSNGRYSLPDAVRARLDYDDWREHPWHTPRRLIDWILGRW
jgi:hypothetical protein